MEIKECTVEDVPLLAKMNQLFIEDEEQETNLSLPHLEERLRGYFRSEYLAFFFCVDEKIVGYALCSKTRTPMYLRQFFINRDERRKGYGKQAFKLLISHLGVTEKDVDVYAWNDSAVRFWRSLGFEKQRYNMNYQM